MRLLTAIGIACGLASPPLSVYAQAEYNLDVGDAIEIAVAGVSELKQTARVGADGRISLPLLGEMEAAGKPFAEIREQIRASLSTKVLHTVIGGQDAKIAFSPDQVTVNITEYRPLYVMGDVGKPGELPFRPGMTVRQAVALAGGYDLLRARGGDPIYQSADLRGQYEVLWVEFTRERFRIARIRAELEGGAIDPLVGSQAPVPKSTEDVIASTEQDQLRLRREIKAKEKSYYETLKLQMLDQLRVLEQQAKNAEESVKIDAEEAEKIGQLARTGGTTLSRISEVRRSVLFSATRLLQTQAQRNQVMKEQVELERSKTRLDGSTESELIRELQEANVRLATVAARLRATGETLLYATALKSQLTQGREWAPKIAVTRKTRKNIVKMTADENFELNAGDTVEVSLAADVSSLGLEHSGRGSLP